jgi:hypothetical protein
MIVLDYIPPMFNEPGKALLVTSTISGEDFIANRLLSGKAGDLLLQLMIDAGLRSKDFSFASSDIHELNSIVQLLKPEYIIAMGNGALKTLTKKSGMKNHRGKALNLHSSFNYLCPVYPTYSIEDLKNVPTFRKTMVADMRNSQQSEPNAVNFEYWEDYHEESYAKHIGMVTENEDTDIHEGHNTQEANYPSCGTSRNW